jgi:hypothetical protein
MRSLFKLSLASLAAVALFAGMASAQVAPKLSGDIGAGFGLMSYGETNGATAAGKAVSEWSTSWESNLRLTVDSDQITAIARYRARASNGGTGTSTANACTGAATTSLTCTGGFGSSKVSSGTAFASSANDIYHEIWWKPAPNFSLGLGKFQGQAWSQPMSGAYLIINPIGGDGVYWMNWTGQAGIDAEFNAGVVQVGLAISSHCKPSCNSGAGEATQSLVPHLTGKFGAIGIRANLPSTTGTVNCTAVSTDCTAADKEYDVSGSGFQIGVNWTGMPGLLVAADIQSFTDAKKKSQGQDRSRAGTGLRVDFAGVTFHYFSLADSTFVKSSDTTSTEMTLRYTIPVGPGSIIPEYRSTTADDKAGLAKDKNGKAVELTNSEFRLIGRVAY